MFVGHGMVAFALVAAAARALGWPRERALAAAVAAGAFGLAPDVDMLYAPVGMMGAASAMDAATGFWATGNVVHRAITHSLIVAPIAALAAGLWTRAGRVAHCLAIATAVGLVLVAGVVSGILGGVVMGAFVLATLGIAEAARRRELGPRTVGAAALAGFTTHPFGDVLTGTPPAFLYPFDATLVATRPELFADPTLNLLAPLFLELATLWLALLAYARLNGFSLRGFAVRHLRGRAVAAAGFGASALLVPAPTLELSYYFVFPLVGIGLLLAVPVPLLDVAARGDLKGHPPRAAATGLVALTLAALAYTGVYLAAT